MSSLQNILPTNLFSLSGRVALVTGGGTGIGLMITRGLAAAGAKVYIGGRRLPVLEKIAKEWEVEKSEKGSGSEGVIIPIQLDVTDKSSIALVRDTIQQKEGTLHVLVNNAGQVGPTSNFIGDANAPQCADAQTLGDSLFNNETFDQWAQLYAINTSSIFFVTTAFLGLLAKGGAEEKDNWTSVINITSISGVIKVAQGHFCYNSSKAAASHLTKMLQTEFAIKGYPIRVNSVSPGVYASEMTFDEIKPEQVDLIGKGLHSTPAKRAGTAGEMAGTVVYLVSKAGGYIQGQEIQIDGGYTAVNPAVV